MKKVFIILVIASLVLGVGYYIQKKNTSKEEKSLSDNTVTGSENGNIGTDTAEKSIIVKQGEVTTTTTKPKLRVSYNSVSSSRNGNFVTR
ncbi:MAG: hypothetical protein EOL88_07020 [Bacteroidia bacterium]|nr:hypothetical protein [Bacteroidales bacterium]NCD41827.1 hypothetical protein [Bacteroidia bacterium]